MRRTRRVYFFAVAGAAGGLVGSILHQHLLLSQLGAPMAPFQRYLYLGALGALIGAPIGAAPSFCEGYAALSLRGALRASAIGALLGAVGGAVALPVAEFLHIELSGGVRGRVVGFTVLGLLVGVAEGINGGARFWRGVSGGALGGAIGGLAVEMLLQSESTYADSGIVALIVLGFTVAAAIALFVNVLAGAWLEGLAGSKADGRIFDIAKFRSPVEAFLGSDKNGGVFIWVSDAEPQHASVSITPDGVRLRHSASRGTTRVNGTPISECMLRNGDVIQIASATFRFRERITALAAPATSPTKKSAITNTVAR